MLSTLRWAVVCHCYIYAVRYSSVDETDTPINSRISVLVKNKTLLLCFVYD